VFISSKVLTKLIKDQYKTILKVGYIDDGIVVIGGEWAVWMDYEHVPNKVKGTIVELAGGLPGKNKLFSLSKDFPTPNYELITPDIEKLFKEIDIADNKLRVSPISLNNSTRLLQADNALQSIVEVKEKLLDLVDLSEVDLDIEGQPTGPCYADDPYGKLFWYNCIGKLYIVPSGKRDNPLFTVLSEVTFDEKLLVSKD
jgi:hypothetical protein